MTMSGRSIPWTRQEGELQLLGFESDSNRVGLDVSTANIRLVRRSTAGKVGSSRSVDLGPSLARPTFRVVRDPRGKRGARWAHGRLGSAEVGIVLGQTEAEAEEAEKEIEAEEAKAEAKVAEAEETAAEAEEAEAEAAEEEAAEAEEAEAEEARIKRLRLRGSDLPRHDNFVVFYEYRTASGLSGLTLTPCTVINAMSILPPNKVQVGEDGRGHDIL